MPKAQPPKFKDSLFERTNQVHLTEHRIQHLRIGTIPILFSAAKLDPRGRRQERNLFWHGQTCKTACKDRGGAFGLERAEIVFQPQAVMRRGRTDTRSGRLSEEGGKRSNNNRAKKLLA
jgi:hypothetical protein